MGTPGVYQSEDDQYADLLAPTFNRADPPEERQGVSNPPNGGAVTSIASPGPDPRQPGSSNYGGPQLQRRPAPVAAVSTPTTASRRVPSIGGGMPSSVTGNPAPGTVPAAASPSGNPTPNGSAPMTWRDMVQAGLVGQKRNADAASQTVSGLANQPDEATVEAPLEAERAKLAQPIDPNQQQYKPGVGTKIIRGLDAVRRGGVLGAFDPADVGAKAYSAPNRQYDVDTQQQTKKVAGVDQQLSQAAQAYKAASDRAKALRQEYGAAATSYNDITKGATEQETAENNAAKDAETARHNQQDEQIRGQQAQNTQQYQRGELGMRGAELDLNRRKFQAKLDEQDSDDPNTADARRQPMIDQATQQVQDIEDKYTYNAGENKYEDEKGNQLTPQQFTDLKNNVSVKLDQTLASKKMKPLGVRFNVNDAVGSQYRKAPPTAAPAPIGRSAGRFDAETSDARL